MTVATEKKTDKLLNQVLREVREVRALVEPISRAVALPKKTAKKLPAGLRQGLKEMRDGKLSGPFNTVDELMAHLENGLLCVS